MTPDFDETQWARRVQNEKIADLYAPHAANGTFFNPWMPMEEKGFLRLLAWKFSSKRKYSREETEFKPASIPDPLKAFTARPGDDSILWVGHATFLLRLAGSLWLTDPMFSERALLPKRKIPPALSIDEVNAVSSPGINVIISHNHYDHLDAKSIKGLPAHTRFFVPLGLKKFFAGLGKENVVEMDWWQALDLGDGITIVCLPVQHWSRRIGQGIDESLWAGFLLITPRATVYYGGDSGYFIGFAEIGRRYPGIDYALMPTTAYHPRWFMHYAHMDVDEALNAFDDLKARYFIPTQWGVFHLGDEPPGFPVIELKKKITERGLDPSRFIIMDIGQTHFITK
jgi:N-acyl-phosphatidylethanolamine-hydrolysing phospholipase D